MHGEGGCVWRGRACVVKGGGMRGMHAPPFYEIRRVNARAVRILLECILVFSCFFPQGYAFVFRNMILLFTYGQTCYIV